MSHERLSSSDPRHALTVFPPGPASIIWRRLDAPGHDAATLSIIDSGIQVEGVAAFLESGLPCQLRYRVELDDRWRTRMADIRGWLGATRIDLGIRSLASRQWLLNDTPMPSATGCIDVDLAFTPATNLLPIRPLNLSVGSSAPVVAAWLPFPDLELRPLDQVYRRTSEDTYDYSSSGGTFNATLKVSPDGFVTDYPGLWREERGSSGRAGDTMQSRTADVFFYGLFMDQELLRGKGLTPRHAELASVDGLALRIGQRAALVPQPGSRVHGVVFSLTLEELHRLYSEASVRAYQPQAVLARLASGAVIAALCYNLPQPPSPGEGNPDYAAKLRAVAEKAGLPPDYVASIR